MKIQAISCKAYREARKAARQVNLAEELAGYVESGKLTQAQADLLLENSDTITGGEEKRSSGKRGKAAGSRPTEAQTNSAEAQTEAQTREQTREQARKQARKHTGK